jgi:DNA-binding IclR family transcriptional regulator
LKPLSKAERRILDALAASKVARGRLPTTKELCHDAHTGRAHVIRSFARLVEAGYLRRTVQTVLVDFGDKHYDTP